MMDTQETRVYWVWADMLSRCRNPNHKAFANYGGRGISVCERWQTFANFTADMGERPDGGMLDRIDNDLGYGPDNCRWADRATQNRNRRNCVYVEIDGQRLTIKEACRAVGMPYRPVMKRIQDRGWPIGLALSAPIGTRKANIA